MDKIAYFKHSQERGLPLRCPLVGYCKRWAFSVYFNTYSKEELSNKTVTDVLKGNNELPLDFDGKKVEICGDPVISHNSNESLFGYNFCPEIALFSEHSPWIVPKEAISSYSWSKYEGFRTSEYKHFSECLEFIQTEYFRQAEAKELKIIMDNSIYQYGSGDNIGRDKVMGDKIGTQINNGQDLVQAAQNIKSLLERLSIDYPDDSHRVLGAKAVDLVEQNPDLRSRIMRGVKAGSFAALEKMIDHPVAKFFIEGAKEIFKQ